MANQKGFTLVELIIGIAIIIVVFAISIPITNRYLGQRSFESAVNEVHSTLNFAYQNSVQGVLGADKHNSLPAGDTDTATDRVAWFVQINRSTDTVAIGACLPDTDPTDISRCLGGNNDRDYRRTTYSSRVNITSFTSNGSTVNADEMFAVFTPITGQLKLYMFELEDDDDEEERDAVTAPLTIDIVMTHPTESTMSSTLRINSEGGVRKL